MLPMDKVGKKRALAMIEPLDLGEPAMKKVAEQCRSAAVGRDGR